MLRTKRILISRKEGNQVFYSVRDPRIIKVLDVMREYFYDQLAGDRALLEEIESPPEAS